MFVRYTASCKCINLLTSHKWVAKATWGLQMIIYKLLSLKTKQCYLKRIKNFIFYKICQSSLKWFFRKSWVKVTYSSLLKTRKLFLIIFWCKVPVENWTHFLQEPVCTWGRKEGDGVLLSIWLGDVALSAGQYSSQSAVTCEWSSWTECP